MTRRFGSCAEDVPERPALMPHEPVSIDSCVASRLELRTGDRKAIRVGIGYDAKPLAKPDEALLPIQGSLLEPGVCRPSPCRLGDLHSHGITLSVVPAWACSCSRLAALRRIFRHSARSCRVGFSVAERFRRTNCRAPLASQIPCRSKRSTSTWLIVHLGMTPPLTADDVPPADGG